MKKRFPVDKPADDAPLRLDVAAAFLVP